DAETFRNFKLNHYSWTYDFEKMAEKVPQGGKEMVEAMKTMMGDGVKSWAGTDGKVFVQIIAKDWASAQRMLEDYLDGKNTVGSQQPFQDARKHLPAQASMVVLMDGPQYTQMMGEFMGPIMKAQGLPFNLPALKAPKGKSFFGMALGMQPEQGSVDFWIPVTAVTEIRKMVEPLIGGGAIQ